MRGGVREVWGGASHKSNLCKVNMFYKSLAFGITPQGLLFRSQMSDPQLLDRRLHLVSSLRLNLSSQ